MGKAKKQKSKDKKAAAKAAAQAAKAREATIADASALECAVEASVPPTTLSYATDAGSRPLTISSCHASALSAEANDQVTNVRRCHRVRYCPGP